MFQIQDGHRWVALYASPVSVAGAVQEIDHRHGADRSTAPAARKAEGALLGA